MGGQFINRPILLVEDDANDVLFFEYAAKKAGVAAPLRVARDGREALDYLLGAGQFADRAKYPLPRLTLLDLNLPKVTGFEVLREIRRRPELRKLIVVVMTSSFNEEDISNCYELGANAYVVKPADTNELLDIVRSVQHFWLKHNHPAPVETAG